MTTSAHLGDALRHAVQAQGFEHEARAFPSIDLALIVFPRDGSAPRAGNVLFSREHPQGHVAPHEPTLGPLRGVRFDADLRSDEPPYDSLAWDDAADWQRLPFTRLHGPEHGSPRFVAPYPASLIKLMVAVGIALAVDDGSLAAWPDALEPMITVSSNEATDTCVALLHRAGWLPMRLNEVFAHHGLPTLQLAHTTPQGGWRNADGAGVGRLQMTAWDTVRLLWLLDDATPPAPWLPPGTTPLMSDVSRARLRATLAAQQLDEVLSSGRLRSLPGWVPGLPDAPVFAHKTGTTDNYASDAGIVHTPQGHHALVAVLTSLGRRFAPHEACATTWRLPALGGTIAQLIEGHG